MAPKNNAKRKRNNHQSSSSSSTSKKHNSKKGKTLTATSTADSPDSTPRGHGKVLTKKDHDAAVAALQLVDWKNVVNTSRRNVIPDNAPRTKGILQGGKGKANKAFCHSFILGPNMKDPERRPSYWTESNPGLFDVLNAIMRKVDPDHEYTNITVNKNLRCKAHRDRGNVGMSYIVGFGGYSGGELMVGPRTSADVSDASSTEQTNKSKQHGRSVDKATRANAQAQTPASGPSEDEIMSAVEHDLHARFVSFYGQEQLHWTLPFVGDRYTCVFYKFPLHPTAAKIKEQTGDASRTTTTTSTTDTIAPQVLPSKGPSKGLAEKLALMSNKLKKKCSNMR